MLPMARSQYVRKQGEYAKWQTVSMRALYGIENRGGSEWGVKGSSTIKRSGVENVRNGLFCPLLASTNAPPAVAPITAAPATTPIGTFWTKVHTYDAFLEREYLM